MDIQIMRLPEVIAATGLQRSSIYALARIGAFPAPIKLTAKAVGWPSNLVRAWIEQRVKANGGAK